MLTRRHVLGGTLASALVVSPVVMTRLCAAAPGTFKGRVVAEWLPDGRRMRLLEPFEYIDPNNRRWPAPAGIIVDGASIPQIFWSLIGGPFEGRYRAASVIHDFYCDTRTRRFREVHRVFYDGMLTAGVDPRRAWVMYMAVDTFGPTWPDPKIDPACEIVDENYDFEKCGRNAAPPPVSYPSASREELSKFVDRIAPEADSEDVRKLRDAISRM